MFREATRLTEARPESFSNPAERVWQSCCVLQQLHGSAAAAGEGSGQAWGGAGRQEAERSLCSRTEAVLEEAKEDGDLKRFPLFSKFAAEG